MPLQCNSARVSSCHVLHQAIPPPPPGPQVQLGDRSCSSAMAISTEDGKASLSLGACSAGVRFYHRIPQGVITQQCRFSFAPRIRVTGDQQLAATFVVSGKSKAELRAAQQHDPTMRQLLEALSTSKNRPKDENIASPQISTAVVTTQCPGWGGLLTLYTWTDLGCCHSTTCKLHYNNIKN